jgi:hypothetical protein
LQTKADGYDARVSYEDIATWYEVSAPNDPRAAYRARVIKDAIVRARRLGIFRVNEVTAFWRSYWADVSLLYPELEMKEPAPKGPNSTWIQFRPTGLEAGRTLDHKLWRGCLDLSFPNISPTQLNEIRDRWSAILTTQDLTAEQTGGSCAVRAVVPLVNPREEYSTQQTPARAGMKAAYRLLYLSHLLHVPSVGSEK